MAPPLRLLLVAACLAAGEPASAQIFQAPCFPGTASPTGLTPCSTCPEQTFAPGRGNEICIPCPDGTYADEPGQAECVRDVVQWPGEPPPFPLVGPCEHEDDLERCIEGGIRHGGIVEIVTENPPPQEVTIFAKSFTLRAAPGVTPVFSGTTRIQVEGSFGPVVVVIEGLELSIDGSIHAFKRGPGFFSVTLRNSVVSAVGAALILSNNSGAGATGTTELRVEDSVLVSGGDGAAIRVVPRGPPVDVRIRGNAIASRPAAGLAAAPAVYIDHSGTLTGEVTLNTIVGGLMLTGSVDSESTLRIVNNLMEGQQETGWSAVAIDSHGKAEVEILGNTVVDNPAGIIVVERDDLADVSALIANNLVAFNETGIVVGSGVDATNEFNLVHGNASNDFTPGPGTVTEDPLLRPDGTIAEASPARNAGSNAYVPLELVTDLLGAPRIAGPSVDIGAFEFPVPEPPGALGGWLALATLAARRARATGRAARTRRARQVEKR